ncbi:UvrD-helicase domain-containing protein [Collinsella tanakaei]|uniref:UvrD-helicase domain-containing protein n=1 Tax=Collinsella tanakaei TaxID=626935 RepID=UPI0025A48FB6|nr:UvrD-helicase domain-containing protein [Collinsella tanakaei]MDM8301020.1 UvrD-helicase domain-containing protein [Collinsella tanakaei]
MTASSNPSKRIYVAGAGTGKTSMLREIALERCIDRRVLYLTYTDANAAEFREAIVRRVGHMPVNITVMTWFSFLLIHGVRPFPARGFNHRIDRMLFNDQDPRNARGVQRGDERYYCPHPGVAYRTRLADLAFLCNEQWGGEVVQRVCNIFGAILVDEAQDFAGYDYDLLHALMKQSKEMVIVGDPRQQTYRTGAKAKNKANPDIFDFFVRNTQYTVDSTTLSVTHRCSDTIISLANRLYDDYPPVAPSGDRARDPRGRVTTVSISELKGWALSRKARTVALVWDSRTTVPLGFPVMTMGESKGLTLEDVVIFPTGEMKKWIENKPSKLKGQTKAKFYVAMTRARGDLYFVV